MYVCMWVTEIIDLAPFLPSFLPSPLSLESALWSLGVELHWCGIPSSFPQATAVDRLEISNQFSIHSTVFDFQTQWPLQQKNVPSCPVPRTRKRFNGGLLLVDSLQSLAVADWSTELGSVYHTNHDHWSAHFYSFSHFMLQTRGMLVDHGKFTLDIFQLVMFLLY